MRIALEEVDEDRLPVLDRLVELAAYDMSEHSGVDIGETGTFAGGFHTGRWFGDRGFHMFFIRVDRRLGGFAIVRKPEQAERPASLAHFFVLRKYRRQGVGREAAVLIFDRFRGPWRVDQFDWNGPARQFWLTVIRDYTNGRFTTAELDGGDGTCQTFRNDAIPGGDDGDDLLGPTLQGGRAGAGGAADT